MSSIDVQGIVAARDKQPYVVLHFEGKRVQLTIADARKVAADITQLAARAEADAMILQFFDKQEYPTGAAAALMMEFRAFRLQLDTEPVEGFYTNPDKPLN